MGIAKVWHSWDKNTGWRNGYRSLSHTLCVPWWQLPTSVLFACPTTIFARLRTRFRDFLEGLSASYFNRLWERAGMGERQRYRERHSKRQRGRRESGRQAQEGRGGGNSERESREGVGGRSKSCFLQMSHSDPSLPRGLSRSPSVPRRQLLPNDSLTWES